MCKKLLILLMMATIMTSLLAGCGETDNPQTGDKTVRLAVSKEPDSLNPYKSSADDTDAMLMNIHRGLVFFDINGNIIPSVAKNWDISDDGLNYRFYLRDDVKFHNGDTLTADDVVYSYELLSGLGGGEAMNSKFKIIMACEKVDNYTVDITLGSVDASFLSRCKAAVLPKDYDGQNTNPIGCGPFKFVDYSPADSIKLEKFDGYFDKEHMPKIDGAEFLLIQDPNSQFLAVQTGAADIATVSFEDAALLDDAGFSKLIYATNIVQGLWLNLDAEPFDNVLVRRALNHAIDRHTINEVTSGGKGLEATTLLTPGYKLWYNEETENAFPYDIEKAKELLKEAGYENGFDMVITVPSDYKPHVDAAQMIVDQLAKVNIRASIKLVEFGQWLDEVYTKFDYQATVNGLAGKLDPYDLFIRYQSGYSRNFCRYANPEYDRLLELGRETIDQSERTAIFNEMQQILVDDAVSVCIQDITAVYAMNKNITGFTSYPVTFYDLSLIDKR